MENTVAQKLDALQHLQSIDSELDEIKKIRGDLPEEVRDLEDDIVGQETRIGRLKQDVTSLKEEISKYKQAIKDSEKLIKKYQEQQVNVRNNRVYDAISKEMESQGLDIQIFEKRIKECNFRIEQKAGEIEVNAGVLEERRKDLDNKRVELEQIMQESRDEEGKLAEKRDEAAKLVDERLYYSYKRLRENSQNGLAVVPVKRGACGGCFNMVPPQRQADIRERKKIIVCEHCGRILANVEAPEVELARAAR
ncbi:MAG: C4-type zinc ribbon domain-containing protein [Bacteroidota bacterium]